MKNKLPLISNPAELPDISPYWYLATPYSKYPSGIWFAFIHAARVSAHLAGHGIPHYRPIVASHPVAIHGGLNPLDHDIWMKDNEPFMETAGGLLVANMSGWDTSYGIGLEIDHFEAEAKPMFLLDVGGLL